MDKELGRKVSCNIFDALWVYTGPHPPPLPPFCSSPCPHFRFFLSPPRYSRRPDLTVILLHLPRALAEGV
eukprot:273540-Pyramimonas_sp.AAC.1